MKTTGSFTAKFISPLLLPFLFLATSCREAQEQKQDTAPVTFGIISDVHQDLQPNAPERLEKFLKTSREKQPAFIIQLGDLSHGKNITEEKKGINDILAVWNRYPGEKYHVIGNHELDYATKEQIVKKQEMPATYYSFDKGVFHFIVLDANYDMEDGVHVDSRKGFRVNPEQLEWLRQDLASTDKYTIIFSHPGLDENWQHDDISPSRLEIREIFRQERLPNGASKVIACFCGHHHIDLYSKIDDIHYFHINSASYFWIGGSNVFSRGNMAEYKDSIYAFVTLDPEKRSITIKGKESEFLPPAPTMETYKKADRISAKISDRIVTY